MQFFVQKRFIWALKFLYVNNNSLLCGLKIKEENNKQFL